MNLLQLREEIANALNFDPNNEKYKEQIDNRLNAEYRKFFVSKDFSFAQRETSVFAQADKIASDGSVTKNSSSITTATSFFSDDMNGQIIVIGEKSYQIAYVETASQAYLTSDFLEDSATGVTFTVQYQRLDFPADCVKVLEMFVRSPNVPENICSIVRSEEAFHHLDFSDSGTPEMWVLADTFHQRAPKNQSLVASTSGSGHGTRTVEIAMTYTFGGKESALSVPQEITLADTEILKWTFSNRPVSTGLYFKVYCRNKSISNRFYQVEDNGGKSEWKPSEGGTYYFNLDEIGFDDLFVLSNTAASDHGGSHKRFRLWPRQGTDRDVYIRYLYRPAPLVDDEDTPDFDEAYHDILVHLTVKEICYKLNRIPLGSIHKAKAEREAIKIERDFIHKADKIWKRDQASSFVSKPRPNTFLRDF